MLADGHGISRERRLGGFERGGFRQTRIRRHDIAGGKQHDVARHVVIANAGIANVLPRRTRILNVDG